MAGLAHKLPYTCKAQETYPEGCYCQKAKAKTEMGEMEELSLAYSACAVRGGGSGHVTAVTGQREWAEGDGGSSFARRGRQDGGLQPRP